MIGNYDVGDDMLVFLPFGEFCVEGGDLLDKILERLQFEQSAHFEFEGVEGDVQVLGGNGEFFNIATGLELGSSWPRARLRFHHLPTNNKIIYSGLTGVPIIIVVNQWPTT